MNTRPEQEALEQRLRQMAESLEVPSALSPENMLRKLPERKAPQRIQIRRYSAAAALAACLLVVVTSGMLLRNFSGGPVIDPESSLSSAEGSSYPEESSYSAGSSDETSDPPESAVSSRPAEPSSATESSPLPESSETTASSDAPSSSLPSGETSGPASAPESSTNEPDPGNTGAEGPEGGEVSGPPAVNLPDEKLSEVYQNIYDTLSTMERSAVFEAPAPYSLSSRATNSIMSVDGAEEAGVAKADKNLLCSLETDEEGSKVSLYRLLGKSSSLVTVFQPEAQLPALQGLYLAYTDFAGLYLQDDLLILLGSAQYVSEEADYAKNISLSFAVIYDVSNPKFPRPLSTLAQEGSLLTGVMQEGKLMLFSQYSLLRQELDAEDVESYIPTLYRNGSPLLPSPDRIQIGQVPDAPVYSCIALIDLKKPTDFADFFFYLGGSDGLYLQDDVFCLSQSTNEGAVLSLFTIDGNRLSLCNEQLMDGQLIGGLFIDRKNQAIRAAIYREDGGTELFLFNNRLEELSSIPIPATNGDVISLKHMPYITYFYHESGESTAVDCSLPRRPQLLARQDAPYVIDNYEGYLFPYGQKGVLQAETLQEGEPGLRLSLIQVNSPFSSEVLCSFILSGDIDADFFYDSESLMLDSSLGLVGFSAALYDEDGGREHVYFLLRYDSEEGLTLLGQYELPQGDYSRGFIKNSNIYVSVSDQLLVIDGKNGEVLKK